MLVSVGSSNAEDATAVSSAQLKAHKLMQEFAISRGSFIPALPAGIPGPGMLGPLGGPVGPSPAGPMALVPVMLPSADGSYIAAYQVQPVPSAGFATDPAPAEFSGGWVDPLSGPWHLQAPAFCFIPTCET